MAMRLEPKNVAIMRLIQAKFATDAYAFYSSLIGHYSQQRNEGWVRELTAARQDVTVVKEKFDKILDPSKEKISDADINAVLAEMDGVRKKLEGYKLQAEKDTDLNAKLEKILYNKELDITKMTDSMRVASQKLMKMNKAGMPIIDKWKQFSPETLSGVTDIAGSAAKSLMGPFAGLGEGIFNAAKGIYTRSQERKKTLEQNAFLGKMLNAGESTPEQFYKMQAYMATSGRAPIPQNLGGGFNFASMFGGGAGGKKEKSSMSAEKNVSDTFTGMPGMAGAVSADPETIRMGLHIFFDQTMLSTKWSKALFKLLGDEKKKDDPKKTIGEKAVEKTGDGFWGGLWNMVKGSLPKIIGMGAALAGVMATVGTAIMGAITGMIPFILGALAVIVAGAIGWAIGKWIGGLKIGGKTVNDWIGIGIDKAGDIGKGLGKGFSFAGPIGGAAEAIHGWFGSDKKGTPTIPSPDSTGTKTATVPTPTATPKVPIPTASVGVASEQTQSSDKLQTSLGTLIDEVKKMGKSASGMPISGFNAFNIRNPLLSALSIGGIEIDE